MVIQKKKKQTTKEKSEPKSDVLQRLAQASVEGLAVQVAMNAVLPGAGIALKGLNQAKNMKKAAKVMGKGMAKEGVQMLDEKDNSTKRQDDHPLEEFREDLLMEFLSRGGRG